MKSDIIAQEAVGAADAPAVNTPRVQGTKRALLEADSVRRAAAAHLGVTGEGITATDHKLLPSGRPVYKPVWHSWSGHGSRKMESSVHRLGAPSRCFKDSSNCRSQAYSTMVR